MLMDNGSTNNFIDLSLAKKLRLKLIPIKKMDVSVADGFKVGVHFVCKNVMWSVLDHQFVTALLAMPIGGYGVVFGIAWLSTLGDIQSNFEKLTMAFYWKGIHVELQGHKINCSTDKSKLASIYHDNGMMNQFQGVEFWSLKLNDNIGSHLDVKQKEELTLLLDSF